MTTRSNCPTTARIVKSVLTSALRGWLSLDSNVPHTSSVCSIGVPGNGRRIQPPARLPAVRGGWTRRFSIASTVAGGPTPAIRARLSLAR